MSEDKYNEMLNIFTSLTPAQRKAFEEYINNVK